MGDYNPYKQLVETDQQVAVAEPAVVAEASQKTAGGEADGEEEVFD